MIEESVIRSISESELKSTIEQYFEQDISKITPNNADARLQLAVTEALKGLASGRWRVAEKLNGQWRTHEWLKKAVLLSFRIQANRVMEGGFTKYFDKVAPSYENFSEQDFNQAGVRVVPPTVVRHGAYVAKDCVLMPSYINIGAYVGQGTLIDTWATVGSCAQIGKNVHISGGTGIGGVLEPLQATPTIIEDNCFIGARSEIVEGVVVEENAVISMGVFIGQSTRIYDRTTGEMHQGRVPAGSVVVPGSLPAEDGSHHLYAAIIVKRVDAATRSKVSLNVLLRP